ncbi:hypothetical protein KIMH_06840 [Bombiscardovia apis]|uniref:SCP domain-containing protein n=1 Tax=Bombiscardovia apis TaxID=2932182 RepID=A0ABN6SH68_9BIFI|nr:CAP domain-containing protein [Bombiscardovia apis]BDR54573.1 hypothetical protein KIMH_06840 [Bombiscardovia apis]
MNYKSQRSAAKHADGRNWSVRFIKLGLTSAVAGATLIGCVSPALAADATPSSDLQAQVDTASKVLEAAKATLKQKQDASTKTAEYQAQGSAGYFKYVGATGAYSVLTDSAVNGKLASSIKLGQADDATSMANMKATLTYLQKCNELRKAEGKGELKVSDTLMAMAQADTDWAAIGTNWPNGEVDHPRQFEVAENLSWSYPDPFTGWYDEEKVDLQNGGTNHGHYDNIVNGSYDITGFAQRTNSPNTYGGNTHGQTFYFSSMTEDELPTAAGFKRSSNKTPQATVSNARFMLSTNENSSSAHTYSAMATKGVWAGSRIKPISDYFADVTAYETWLTNPQADIATAQQAVDAAQKSYNDLAAQAGIMPGTDGKGSVNPADPNATAPAEGNSSAAAPVDPSTGTGPRASDPSTLSNNTASPSASTADPARRQLAKTGSNVLGVGALALGLFLIAAGAFTLRRQAR